MTQSDWVSNQPRGWKFNKLTRTYWKETQHGKAIIIGSGGLTSRRYSVSANGSAPVVVFQIAKAKACAEELLKKFESEVIQ